jgi:hypothetical protein
MLWDTGAGCELEWEKSTARNSAKSWNLNSNVKGSRLKGSGLPITQLWPERQQAGLKDKEVKMESRKVHDADCTTRDRGHY